MTNCKFCGKPVYFGSLYHPSCVEAELSCRFPQKVKAKADVHGYENYYCPKCGKQQKNPGARQLRDGSYCERCGQRLDWREEE